jgi:hypothetical protein
MSVRESSDERATSVTGATRFTRWPGLLSLSLGVLLGPVVALINQQVIYQSDMWACGFNAHGTLHVIPTLCVIVAVGAAVAAYRNWIAVGRGVEVEHDGVDARTRFLALLGISISVFSALVIIAQWLAIFVFTPCMRA